MQNGWVKSTPSVSLGGESGIRTHDTREGMPVFKTGAINRSAISPSFNVKRADPPIKNQDGFG